MIMHCLSNVVYIVEAEAGPGRHETMHLTQLSMLRQPMLPAGILYHDMYASDLVGTHVEMRSLEVRTFYVFLAATH